MVMGSPPCPAGANRQRGHGGGYGCSASLGLAGWTHPPCDTHFKAGQRLNELALAQALGVSRSPVREACRKLEQAGMVEIINNRWMLVRRVDLQQALDTYEIRGALAGQVFKRHVLNGRDRAINATGDAQPQD